MPLQPDPTQLRFVQARTRRICRDLSAARLRLLRKDRKGFTSLVRAPFGEHWVGAPTRWRAHPRGITVRNQLREPTGDAASRCFSAEVMLGRSQQIRRTLVPPLREVRPRDRNISTWHSGERHVPRVDGSGVGRRSSARPGYCIRSQTWNEHHEVGLRSRKGSNTGCIQPSRCGRHCLTDVCVLPTPRLDFGRPRLRDTQSGGIGGPSDGADGLWRGRGARTSYGSRSGGRVVVSPSARRQAPPARWAATEATGVNLSRP